MYIISGEFKGRKILQPKQTKYRPTMGKVKEALFSMLTSGKYCPTNFFEEITVLDLCSGSGSLGLECLSRGAEMVTFVDNDKEALEFIRKTAEKFGVADKIRIEPMDIIRHTITGIGRFNLIMIDPPYNEGMVVETVKKTKKMLEKQGFVIVEHSPNEDPGEHNFLERLCSKKYTRAMLTLYRFVDA